MRQSAIRIKITSTGLEFIYDDELLDLTELGEVAIVRASHVEPFETGAGWQADMSPVDGPMLGPFPTRAAALLAETAWIDTNII